MELIRKSWTKSDINEFNIYLQTFSRPEKEEWTKRIINTQMEVLAIISSNLKAIVKDISKGNFIGFLNLNMWDYYETTIINGQLINKIKDFEKMKEYLIRYAENIDNWASCDVLSFNITETDKYKFLNLSKELVKSKKTFVRRVGIKILFYLIKFSDLINDVFDIVASFKKEKEYYVNMINAWLIAELFIKQRDKTLEFLNTKSNDLNLFTINKAIQKCRDSFRVSDEDKAMLLKFKRKY